jgi:hypothetical protein
MAVPRVENGVVMVRTAHCFTCGDVETGVDLRCPTCGDLCPAVSAGRPRPRDVVVDGESTAATVAPAAGSGPRVVMPASAEALRWRQETERLLASQEARRKAIREIFGPLQAEDAQLKASIAALKQVLSQVGVADGPVVAAALSTDGKRWSRKYDRCQDPECRTPEKKHNSLGLCDGCYVRQARSKSKATGE